MGRGCPGITPYFNRGIGHVAPWLEGGTVSKDKLEFTYEVDGYVYDVSALEQAMKTGLWDVLKGPLKTSIVERVRVIIWLQARLRRQQDG